MDAALDRSKNPPAELQLLWVVQAWGSEVLGPAPDFLRVLRLHQLAHALETFRVYAKPTKWKDLTQAQWRVIRDTITDPTVGTDTEK